MRLSPAYPRVADRDAKILSLWQSGVSQAAIARRMKITRERIRQILGRELPFEDYMRMMCGVRRERMIATAQRMAMRHNKAFTLKTPKPCVVCSKPVYTLRQGQSRSDKNLTCSRACSRKWVNNRESVRYHRLAGGVTVAPPAVNGKGSGSNPLLPATQECPCNDP